MFAEQLADTQKMIFNEKSLFSVRRNTFMIEHFVQKTTCITYNRSDNLKAAKCNSSDPLQKWIWTRHNQLLHVDTLKCIQQGQEYSGTNYTWYLGLEECNISETKQKWNCYGYLLQKSFVDSLGQPRSIRITQEKYTILAKLGANEWWQRYGNSKTICSSCMLPSNFTLSFMIINVLYFFCYRCPPIIRCMHT